MDLSKYKGVDLDTKVAEQYAKERLGLDDNWCAFYWSHHIDDESADDALEKLEGLLEGDCDIHFLEATIHEMSVDMATTTSLAKSQMLVKLVNAPNLEAARKLWDAEVEVTYKACVIDWELVQELVK